MESTTKNRQSPETLRALIERAYGADAVPTTSDFAHEITEGWFNVAYRITLRDSRQVVLKIAPPANVPVLTREVNMMRAELEAMRLVSTQTTVPVPRVDFADLTHELIDADYFFMEYIDADNFGFSTHLSPEVIAAGNRELGALNREINTITGPHFGPLVGPGYPTWREAFHAMIEDTLTDGERVGIDLGWTSNDIRSVIHENAAALDEVTVPHLVEVDLWTKNSMIRDGRIVAILDHERAIYGDPLMEAGLTGLDLPSFGDPTNFMIGFGIASPADPSSAGLTPTRQTHAGLTPTTLTPAQRTRRRLYSLYLAVIMIVETKYRGHTDTEVYDLGRECLDALMAQFGRLTP